MKTLTLNVKKEYFEQTKDETKPEEFRLFNEYWKKRLVGKKYDNIIIKLGYPKASDSDRIIERPWNGYTVRIITHPHFGLGMVKVFAIRVNDPVPYFPSNSGDGSYFQSNHCPIQISAMLGEQPKQWCYVNKQPTCLSFVKRDAYNAYRRTKLIASDKRNYDLFEDIAC